MHAKMLAESRDHTDSSATGAWRAPPPCQVGKEPIRDESDLGRCKLGAGYRVCAQGSP